MFVNPESSVFDTPTLSLDHAAIRGLNTPATFVVDAAHNGFTVSQAYALYKEKHVLNGYVLEAFPLLADIPGETDEIQDGMAPWSRWRREWQQAWAEMQEWRQHLALVTTPTQWEAYLEAAKSQGLVNHWMYQLWTDEEDKREEKKTPIFWMQLHKIIRDNMTPILPTVHWPMPRRWTSAKADQLLRRWMRRVGLQVLQWPWGAGTSRELKWQVFCAVRSCQQKLVAFTGWSGPVLGLGGPLWWSMGNNPGKTGGSASASCHVPWLSTGGHEWVDCFFHEWFHLLDSLLSESAYTHERIKKTGLGITHFMSAAAFQVQKDQFRPDLPLDVAMAFRALWPRLRALAPRQAPEDWHKVKTYQMASYPQKYDMLPYAYPKEWKRETRASQTMVGYPSPSSPAVFSAWVRNMPSEEGRASPPKDRLDNILMAYRYWQVHQENVPGWFERVEAYAQLHLKWDVCSQDERRGRGWVWWHRHEELLAEAFQYGIDQQATVPCYFVTSPTPLECQAMRPAWVQFFKTLAPTWDRLAHLRPHHWRQSIFPMPTP